MSLNLVQNNYCSWSCSHSGGTADECCSMFNHPSLKAGRLFEPHCRRQQTVWATWGRRASLPCFVMWLAVQLPREPVREPAGTGRSTQCELLSCSTSLWGDHFTQLQPLSTRYEGEIGSNRENQSNPPSTPTKKWFSFDICMPLRTRRLLMVQHQPLYTCKLNFELVGGW